LIHKYVITSPDRGGTILNDWGEFYKSSFKLLIIRIVKE
jgi:hypothetical protein